MRVGETRSVFLVVAVSSLSFPGLLVGYGLRVYCGTLHRTENRYVLPTLQPSYSPATAQPTSSYAHQYLPVVDLL